MTGLIGRPGRKPKASVESLEQEIREAQKRLEILRRQEAERVRRELDRARMIVGGAMIESVARRAWNQEQMRVLEGRLFECVSRESDQKFVRRAFSEGRRLAEERMEKPVVGQGKTSVATPQHITSRDKTADQGA